MADRTNELADPRRIALIAVRCGSGSVASIDPGDLQAVVIGEVPMRDGVIADPNMPGAQWQWRYALYPLDKLQLLFKQAREDLEAKKNWKDIAHPLDPKDDSFSREYYDRWGPGDPYGANVPRILADSEIDELLAPHELSSEQRAFLAADVKPYLDDQGTQSTVGIPRLNFAIPLRDILRISIYDRDQRPLYRKDTDDGGALFSLHTCRHETPGGSVKPERATTPLNGPAGTRIVLVTDPEAVDQSGALANRRISVQGKLRAYMVLGQTRLPLNGHASESAAGEIHKSRAVFRLYAVNGNTPRRLFGDELVVPQTHGDAKGIGPLFDSMRCGFTLANPGGDIPTPALSNVVRDAYLGELNKANARARVPLSQPPSPPVRSVPILDQLGIGTTTDSARECGFRFVAREPLDRRMILRFEAFYYVTDQRRLGLAFAPRGAIGDPHRGLRFAQEQRLDAVDWRLVPERAARWVFTARVDDPPEVLQAVVDAYNERAAAVHTGLRQARDATPISLMPTLSQVGSANAWHFTGTLIDRDPYNARMHLVQAAKPARRVDADFFTLEQRAIDDMWQGDARRGDQTPLLETNARAAFPRLTLTDKLTNGRNLEYDVKLCAPMFAAPSESKPPPWVAWPAFQPAMSGRLPEHAYRGVMIGIRAKRRRTADATMWLGAVEIATAEDFGASPALPGLHDGLIRFVALGSSGDQSLAGSGIDAVIKLPVRSILPAGQDDLPDSAHITRDDRIIDALAEGVPDRDAPLMIPLDPPPAAPKRVVLTANETVTRHLNHTVALSLSATDRSSASNATYRLLVVDPAPFRVAVINSTNLAAAATNEANEVAVWNAGGENGLSWRIVDDAGTVRILLPPQVIGEAMEKSNDAGYPVGIDNGQPAASRFGSHARLDIAPSYFDTRYIEPGWNLRRIMGYPGQRAPGAGLRDLRLELMYGMVSRISPAGPGVRIAEIGSQFGAPAARISADGATVGAYVHSFNAMIAASSRRLAVDRLWRENIAGDLTLEQDVSFKLRVAVPKDDGTGYRQPFASPFRWPFPGKIPQDADAVTQATFSDGEGFAGGVPWAFESPNILRSVYRNTRSDGGRVHNVHVSALGGWGSQRGLFDLKKSAIETDTTMGRVHRYALERIGRIGGLWNRAKHVIVYERSVTPSAQFYSQQGDHSGRPLLRKVQEYVEILQPVRRYPEGDRPAEATGFLLGVEFVSRRINVDSRWGGDIRAEGWQVPLWNKAFDRPPDDPNNPDDPTFVYPKPQVRFIVAGEAGTEKVLEVAEPEKLVFYTSVLTSEPGDNTDAWAPVRDIDFLDLPPPEAGKRKPQPGTLHDGMLPGEPPHVPGYERLTIGVVPATETVSLAHGRQDDGPVAALRNLTIARALVRTSPAGATQQVGEIVDKIAQSMSSVRTAMDDLTGQLANAAREKALAIAAMATPPTTPGEVKALIKQAVADAAARHNVAGSLQNLTKGFNWPKWQDAEGKGRQFCTEQSDRIKAEIDAQWRRVNGAADSAFGTIDRVLADETASIHAHAKHLRTLAAGAKADAIAFIDGLKVRIDNAAAQGVLELRRARANVDAIAALAGGKIDSISASLDAPFDAATAGLGLFVAKVDAAIKPTDDELKDVLAIIAEARRQVGSLIAQAAERSLPQAARTVLLVCDDVLVRTSGLVQTSFDKFDADLAGAKQAAHDAQKAINDIRADLRKRLDLTAAGAKVDGVAGAIDGGIKKIEGYVQSCVAAVFVRLDQAKSDIGAMPDVAGPVADAVDGFAQHVGRLGTDIRTMLQNKVQDELIKPLGVARDALKTDVDAVCTAFEGALGKAHETAADMQKFIDGKLADYQQRIDRALDDISGNLAEAVNQAQDAVTAAGREMEARARESLANLQQRAADYLGGRDPADLLKKGEEVFQQGSDTLRLIRAVGDPPKTDRLGFNRPEVAYVFKEANKIVDITPALALVNRAADTAAALDAAAKSADQLMQSFGIRLPASQLAKELIPDALKDLDISKLFPDFSGLKLDGLFKNLGFPDLKDSEAVKVRHGFDKVELKAWLEAQIEVPFTKPAPLLDFGPVQIVVDQARFSSFARLTVGREGPQKTMNGKLFGDWRVVCGGQTLMTFRRTGLFFDQTGRLDFNIQPDRVELADALQFLTNLVKATGKKGDFEVVPYMRGAVPSGIAARLDMVLPPIQSGAFGISDLSLHVLFGVSVLPEFEIFTELGVGAKLAPFTLNVWILNGGGFLTSRLSFLPTSRPSPLLTFTLEIGIVAGVGLGFTFGVVSGGVWIQVGCAIALSWTTGAGGSTTTVTVFLLIRGNVDVAGLITASISLLLAIAYDGERMIGSGTLNIRVKISMFFTLSVSQYVEYVFAGEKKANKQVGNYSDNYA